MGGRTILQKLAQNGENAETYNWKNYKQSMYTPRVLESKGQPF